MPYIRKVIIVIFLMVFVLNYINIILIINHLGVKVLLNLTTLCEVVRALKKKKKKKKKNRGSGLYQSGIQLGDTWHMQRVTPLRCERLHLCL